MTSTVASMHHIGNMPGFPHSMPGPIPVSFPGPIPPSTLSPSAPPHIPTMRPTSVPTTIQTVQVPVVPVGGGCYNDGMEVVWHGEFSRLFCNFFPPHVWYLSITNSAPQQKWKYYRDSAKVRFCCQDCGNGWTSMKGRVTFWYHLNFATNEGFVQFKLYGQQCKKCNSGKFEYVMWYPEEVSKVMCNVYNKVGQTYYGFMQPPIRIDRRPGRPRNQHNSDLCQACRDGECDQARPFKPVMNGIHMLPNGGIPPSPVTSPPTSNNGLVPMCPPPMIIPLSHQLPMTHIRHGVMTVPINLTTGSQPILTYSVVNTKPAIEHGTVQNEATEPQPVPVTTEKATSGGAPQPDSKETISKATDDVIKNMAAVSLNGGEEPASIVPAVSK